MVLLGLSLSGGTAAQDRRDNARLVLTLDNLFESRFGSTRCPGLSVAAARNHEIIYSTALGKADLEQDVPLTVRSVHRLASLSKPVTGTIVMDLVQSGELSLDDSVRGYLPELPKSYQEVTIRHLLSHQAGVRGYRDVETEVFSTVHYETTRQALAVFVEDRLLFSPGTNTAYTTYGFTVLGAVSEAVTGRPFQKLAQNFFERYHINGISVDDPLQIVPGRVRGYRVDKDGHVENSRFYDTSNKYPGGGFVASADDFMRFVTSVASGQVLNAETLQTMWTTQKTATGETTPFGLGWGVSTADSRLTVGFNGLQPTTTTALRFFPEDGSGLVLVCNCEGAVGFSDLLDDAVSMIWSAVEKKVASPPPPR